MLKNLLFFSCVILSVNTVWGGGKATPTSEKPIEKPLILVDPNKLTVETTKDSTYWSSGLQYYSHQIKYGNEIVVQPLPSSRGPLEAIITQAKAAETMVIVKDNGVEIPNPLVPIPKSCLEEKNQLVKEILNLQDKLQASENNLKIARELIEKLKNPAPLQEHRSENSPSSGRSH